jgi:hypothetical protein
MGMRRSLKKRSAARVAGEFFTPKIWTDCTFGILSWIECYACYAILLFVEIKPTQIVRDYFRTQYVEPALRDRKTSFEVVAGDVHRALRFKNRVPLVCQALTNRTFLSENHLVLEKTEGPPSGLGTRARFFYRLTKLTGAGPQESAFLRLRGAAKEVFQSLGGGDRFIRRERDAFYGPGSGKR